MSHPNPASAAELAAMSAALDEYLFDDRLFKTLSVPGEAGDHLIKMTLGGMLERIAELAGSEAAQQARRALDEARRRHPDGYFERLAREAKSYSDSWNWFLQNCWDGEGRCRHEYGQEVALRLRLQRLLDEAGDHVAVAESRRRIAELDERLRAIWQPADAPHLPQQGRFPRATHWWLYGLPQPSPEAP